VKTRSLLIFGLILCLYYPAVADEIIENTGTGWWGYWLLDNTKFRLKSFNDDIHRIGIKGNIENCNMLISAHIGTHDGDNLYGGYCTLVQGNGVKKLIEICDDDLVGHFALYYDYPTGVIVKSRDKQSLVSFVEQNCTGG
jgi:hypothetical protein